MKISALILAKNEQEMIEDCIRGLKFADEIIVLDQNSQDKTSKISKKLGAKVVKTNEKDFDICRNLLAGVAQYNWLLYVDADERLTDPLTSEIRSAVRSENYQAYYIPRKNIILGKWVKNGIWWPDYSPRLFKKTILKGWEGKVHESPIIDGKFGYLKNPIVHLSARSLSQMLNKSINWSKIEAQLYYKAENPKVNSIKILKGMIFDFVKLYIFKKLIFDGTVGLIEAIYQSTHKAMILVQLWEIQNETDKKFREQKFN